jgi:hypothetical protein
MPDERRKSDRRQRERRRPAATGNNVEAQSENRPPSGAGRFTADHLESSGHARDEQEYGEVH